MLTCVFQQTQQRSSSQIGSDPNTETVKQKYKEIYYHSSKSIYKLHDSNNKLTFTDIRKNIFCTKSLLARILLLFFNLSPPKLTMYTQTLYSIIITIHVTTTKRLRDGRRGRLRGRRHRNASKS